MPVDSSSYRARERGNVLLLPLLALILFGAICYALIIPTGETTMDQEKDLTSAAQITQYPAMLRTTVRRMMTQGIAPQDLDFSPTATATNGVFSAQGGQAPVARAGEVAGSKSRWHFKTAPVDDLGNKTGWFIAGIGSDGSAGKDVFAYLDGLSLPVCTQILRALGLPEEPLVEKVTIDFSGDHEGTPRQTGGAAGNDTTRNADEKYVLSAWAAAKSPQSYACVRNGQTGSYLYYHVIIDQ